MSSFWRLLGTGWFTIATNLAGGLAILCAFILGWISLQRPDWVGPMTFLTWDIPFIAFCIVLTIRLVNRFPRWASLVIVIAVPLMILAFAGPLDSIRQGQITSLNGQLSSKPAAPQQAVVVVPSQPPATSSVDVRIIDYKFVPRGFKRANDYSFQYPSGATNDDSVLAIENREYTYAPITIQSAQLVIGGIPIAALPFGFPWNVSQNSSGDPPNYAYFEYIAKLSPGTYDGAKLVVISDNTPYESKAFNIVVPRQ